jgi:type III secretion protein I
MERFNAIMNAVDPVRQHEEVFSAVPTNTVSRVSVGDVPTGTETLGSQILATLNSASNQYTAAWNDTKLRLERVSRQESMVDMLRLQSDMLQMSVQYELVGKVVARSTQNIDTLVRMS